MPSHSSHSKPMGIVSIVKQNKSNPSFDCASPTNSVAKKVRVPSVKPSRWFGHRIGIFRPWSKRGISGACRRRPPCRRFKQSRKQPEPHPGDAFGGDSRMKVRNLAPESRRGTVSRGCLDAVAALGVMAVGAAGADDEHRSALAASGGAGRHIETRWFASSERADGWSGTINGM
jgi:hypothetical protein